MRRRIVRLAPSFWRAAGQILFLLLFLTLFVKTDYAGADELTWAANLLFRIDPFLAAAAMLATRTVIALMLPALFTLGLTLLFGRFFCGWICPMGCLIDAGRRLMGRTSHSASQPRPGRRHLKYLLLLFLLTAACCGLPLAGYLDPFSLLVRGLTFSVQPALDHAAAAFFTWTYQQAPAWVNALTEPVYSLLKQSVLPFSAKVYGLSVLALSLLLAVPALSWLEPRFFCRKVCPLGALLALTARFSLLRLHGGSTECGRCRQCRTVCPMAAIDASRAIDPAECTLCLQCLDHCPSSRIGYGRRRLAGVTCLSGSGQPADLSRRAILVSLASGALAPLALPSRPLARHSDPLLVRPPGAQAEPDFVNLCLRCGECMKVCIGNALHAAWLEAGLEGIFTPRLIGRLGYCEYNCTLCGQVCPSGAIRKLDRREKQAMVIGRAHFDKNRCLPYASGTPCIVCEEHCPTPDKAIKFREATMTDSNGAQVAVRQPYVVDRLCIGCGICEHKCPVEGAAAIQVTAAGESRRERLVVQDGY